MLSALIPLSLSIDTGIYTNHLSTSHYTENYEVHEINNSNELIGLSLEYEDVELDVATMINSYKRRSYIVGVTKPILESEWISFKLSGGLVTGYERWMVKTNLVKDIAFYVVPELSFTYEDTSLSVRMFGEAVNVSVSYTYTFDLEE